VTTYDSTAIARSLRDLLDDASLYQRLKDGCRRVAYEISWDRLVQGMLHFYEEVTNNSHHRLRGSALENSPPEAVKSA
jgi:glycosyltransferase involved in cell wall biosynthesis